MKKDYVRSFKEAGEKIPPAELAELQYNHCDDNSLYTPEQAIDHFLNGDLDLTIAIKEGCTIDIDEEQNIIGSDQPEADCDILMRIANLMDTTDHMDLYKKHGLFHDGGDDFDYAGSFYYDLVTIIAYAFGVDQTKYL